MHADLKTVKLMHDLKSPLSALKILQSRMTLSHAENGLLGATLAQLETLLSACIGEEDLSGTPIDERAVRKICEQLVNEKRLPGTRHVQLNWQAGPLKINVSRIDLYRILSNLMHNAAQATATNGTIRLSVWELESILVMQVSDSGGAATAEKGWGLGLTIVREILNKHGGALSLKTTKGTTATVTLPKT